MNTKKEPDWFDYSDPFIREALVKHLGYMPKLCAMAHNLRVGQFNLRRVTYTWKEQPFLVLPVPSAYVKFVGPLHPMKEDDPLFELAFRVVYAVLAATNASTCQVDASADGKSCFIKFDSVPDANALEVLPNGMIVGHEYTGTSVDVMHYPIDQLDKAIASVFKKEIEYGNQNESLPSS